MTRSELLLLVPLALQCASVVLCAAATRSPDAPYRQRAVELQRRQLPLSAIFVAAGLTALHWRIVDTYVVAFAALFVLAQIVHAAVLMRGEPRATDHLALRASVVALAGLVALLALDLLMSAPEGMTAG